MPSSQLHQISSITNLIVLANPMSILDIGSGFGKYGVLAREYLELADEIWRKADWKRQIDCIEAFEDYLSPLHAFVYDRIYIGDAAQIVPTLKDRYDLILLIDVLEHFDFEVGVKLLNDCLRLANDVVISTPQMFITQNDTFGNPFETHRSLWGKKHFAQFGQPVFIPDEISLICFLGPSSARVKEEILSLKQRVKTQFPYLRYVVRAIKHFTNLRHKPGQV